MRLRNEQPFFEGDTEMNKITWHQTRSGVHYATTFPQREENNRSGVLIAMALAGLSGALVGLGLGLIFAPKAHAADYYPPAYYVPQPRPVYAPPVVVEPPSAVIVQPRCRTERTTEHDDILQTNDYTEREICD
jgi:hypothetical protein